MTLSRRYSDEADREIFEIAFYFYERSEPVMHRFYASLDKTVDMLCENSELGEIFPNDPEKRIRYRTITDFTNYVIFYRVQGEALEIVRVLHGSQDYSNIFE